MGPCLPEYTLRPRGVAAFRREHLVRVRGPWLLNFVLNTLVRRVGPLGSWMFPWAPGAASAVPWILDFTLGAWAAKVP